MYYHCPKCGKKFKYDTALIPVFGESFGYCPDCKCEGTYEFDGARPKDDADYEEIDE